MAVVFLYFIVILPLICDCAPAKGLQNNKVDSKKTPKIVPKKYPPPQLADMWAPQFRPMGRFFSVNRNNSLRGCSAQYVGLNLLLTAAHCLYTVGLGYNNELEFYQNYQGNSTNPDDAIGTKRRVRKVFIDQRFYQDHKKNFAYDIAILTMEDPSDGGYFYHLGYPDQFESFIAAGYPVNTLDGLFLMKYPTAKEYVSTDYLKSAGSLMTNGASGGAWIAQRGKEFFAVGLNSFKDEQEVSVLSPRFTPQKIEKLLKLALNDLDKMKAAAAV